jgi:hypothetical protein
MLHLFEGLFIVNISRFSNSNHCIISNTGIKPPSLYYLASYNKERSDIATGSVNSFYRSNVFPARIRRIPSSPFCVNYNYPLVATDTNTEACFIKVSEVDWIDIVLLYHLREGYELPTYRRR